MIETIESAVVRVDALSEGYETAVAVVFDDLQQNTQTRQQVENLRASMAGLLGDVRDFRRDLDNTQTGDLVLTQQNAARLLQTWTWERETRKGVLDFAGEVIETARVARGLNEGSDRSTYTTREGDTLQRIAERELGNFGEWPRILAANPGLVPGVLASGLTIIIPEKR